MVLISPGLAGGWFFHAREMFVLKSYWERIYLSRGTTPNMSFSLKTLGPHEVHPQMQEYWTLCVLMLSVTLGKCISQVHLKASIAWKMQCFLWGKRQNNWVIFGLLDSQMLELFCAPWCRNIPISMMGQNPPLLQQVISLWAQGAFTQLPWCWDTTGDMSHSQISEAEVLRVWWEWSLSTTL